MSVALHVAFFGEIVKKALVESGKCHGSRHLSPAPPNCNPCEIRTNQIIDLNARYAPKTVFIEKTAQIRFVWP